MFQSARPWGTRCVARPCMTGLISSFNPRVRGGRDDPRRPGRSSASRFNPRVRGGRDLGVDVKRGGETCFNPRVRGGRDDNLRTVRDDGLFQSARPWGTRCGSRSLGNSRS